MPLDDIDVASIDASTNRGANGVQRVSERMSFTIDAAFFHNSTNFADARRWRIRSSHRRQLHIVSNCLKLGPAYLTEVL